MEEELGRTDYLTILYVFDSYITFLTVIIFFWEVGGALPNFFWRV